MIEQPKSRDFSQIVWDASVEDDCRQLIRLAVREDLGRLQDFTTNALVPHDATGRAAIVARQQGVIAGLPAVRATFEEMAPAVHLAVEINDGARVEPGACVAWIEGPARNLLTCERIFLNFLGRLSGIATLARQYADAVAGTKARIYDTRKTTPGWRRLEKYAAHCGGATNHRLGLFDAVLIKDNHLAHGAAATKTGSFSSHDAVRHAREFLHQQVGDASRRMLIEIEVDTLQQLAEVLPAAPDIVLLDNMPPEVLRQAVAMRDAAAAPVELEASGGVNLATVRAIAESGVDRISVGAITHSACCLDLGLDWA